MKLRGLSRFVDIFASIIGVLSICYYLWNPTVECGVDLDRIIGGVAGGLGALYLFGTLLQWSINRVEFDRILASGSYLIKVVAIVVLMPSMITAALWFNEGYDIVVFSESDTEVSVEQDTTTSISDVFVKVYYPYMDPGQQNPKSEGSDRFLVALFAILGVLLLNGLMVSTIVGWVDGRKDRWNRGVIHYGIQHLRRRRFSVIIGANEITALAIKRLLQSKGFWWGKNRYVLLHTSRDPEQVREELMSHLSEDQMCRVVIYQGLRDSRSEIEHLHLKWANELYILGEISQVDGSDSSHDAMNMRSVNIIAEYLLKNRWNGIFGKYHKLKCSVMFEYQTTYQMLQFADIPKSVKDTMDFIPFNRYESWARKVMVGNKPYNNPNGVASKDLEEVSYIPLDGEQGISVNDPSHVHFVIVGMTNMGVAMSIQTLLQAHYLNYAYSESKGDRVAMKARRTRITFIDSDASHQMEFLKGRYDNLFRLMRHRFIMASDGMVEENRDGVATLRLSPESDYGWIDPIEDASTRDTWTHLFENEDIYNFIDVEMEFIEGDIESANVRSYLRMISDKNSQFGRDSKLTIAICQNDTNQAIATALYMPIEIYDSVQQIWVYQRESGDIIRNLENASNADARYKKLRPFGMLYDGLVGDDEYTMKAMCVNSVYELQQLASGKSRRDILRGFKTSWDNLIMAHKFANYYFVDSIPQKLRAVGAECTVESITEKFARYKNELERMEHNRWDMQELVLGFAACDKKSQDVIKRALEAFRAKEISKAEYKQCRDSYRTSIYHMHNCICSFEHLDNVENEAKDYDAMLNNAIPEILRLVKGIPQK